MLSEYVHTGPAKFDSTAVCNVLHRFDSYRGQAKLLMLAQRGHTQKELLRYITPQTLHNSGGLTVRHAIPYVFEIIFFLNNPSVNILHCVMNRTVFLLGWLLSRANFVANFTKFSKMPARGQIGTYYWTICLRNNNKCFKFYSLKL